VKNGPDARRLVTVLRGGKADRVPNFEIVINRRNLAAILEKEPSGTSLWNIPPEEALAVVLAVRQDAIPCPLQFYLPRGSVYTGDDLQGVRIPEISERRDKLSKFLSVAAGTGVGVCACLSGPFTASCMTSGPAPIESFLLMIYEDPETVERLLDFYTSYSIAVIQGIHDLPFDFFYIGDDVTGFVRPGHLEELWAGRHEKIIRAALDTGKPVLCHCCGSQKEVLPYFNRWGVHAIHPLQPDMNDIYSVRKEYPHIALVGNISVQDVLSFGTPEAVRADTLNHLERLAPDGGYVVGSSHSIIDSVPPENYRAMLNATWEYSE